MFEPDGRNSVQYSGHLMVRGLQIVTAIIALPAIIFAFIFIYTYFQVQAQRVDFEAFDRDPKAIEATIDFNQAAFTMQDIRNSLRAREDVEREKALDAQIAAMEKESYDDEASEFQHNQELAGLKESRFGMIKLAPELSTAAFTVTFQEGKSPQDAHKDFRGYDATPTQWMYFALPFHEGIVLDDHYRLAKHVGIFDTRLSDAAQDFDIAGPANARYTRQGNGGAADSWMDYGLYKMAPTKKWDWSAGRLQIHAKASYNYAAYVGAARVITRVRMAAALGKLDRHQTGNPWEGAVPADMVFALPESEREVFVGIYNKVFKGDLPVVHVRLQSLSDRTIQKYMWPNRDYDIQYGGKIVFPMDSDESGDWSDYHKWFNSMGTTDYFMTGLRLPKSDATSGRVKHSLMDVFFNSSPSLDPDSVAAQQALRKVMTYKFWEPLLDKYGLRSIEGQVKAIITEENEAFAYDIQFARANAHNAYRVTANDGAF